MSRGFARVGVAIPPARLRAMATGAPVASGELTDFAFALIATETQREERLAQLRQRLEHAMQWLTYAGAMLAGFAILSCLFLAIVWLAVHESPY